MALFSFLLISFIIVLLIYMILDVLGKLDATKNVKGPFFISHLLENINKTKDEDILFQSQKYAKIFPRIYKFWIYNKLLVVTDDCDVIQRALNSRELLHKPSIIYDVFGLKFGLISSKYTIWQLHRKLLNSTFNLKILKSFIPLFMEKSRLLAEEMGEHLEKPDFDVMKIAMKYTLESVSGSVLGFKGINKAVVEKISSSISEILSIMGLRIQSVYLWPQIIFKWTSCFNGFYQKDKMTRKNMDRLINELILKKKSNFDGSLIEDEDSLTQPKLFIDQLVSLSEDKERNVQLTDEAIRDECSMMMMAGTETSALTVSYMCLFLGQNLTIQDKLYNEINEEYPSFDEPLTMEILNRLTYLEMALQETMRLTPVGALISRVVEKDFDLGPCTLKPGMVLTINIFGLHRRKDIWGEDAEIYNPERFLPENMIDKHPYSFIPFSAGARNCIGKRYAMMSMKIMMIYILKSYKIKTKLKLNEFRFNYSVTLHLFNTHLIQIEKRTAKCSKTVAKTEEK